MKPFEREGYGSAFNTLYVSENEFYKRAHTLYGKRKLEQEIKAYKVFSLEAPFFPLARLLSHTDDTLVLEYYPRHKPLWNYYKDTTVQNKKELMNLVLSSLQYLHEIKEKSISKEEYTHLLYTEVIQKVRERYTQAEPIIAKYAFHSVNGVPCLSFEECMKQLEISLKTFVASKVSFDLCYIHGDPQFNNTLYDSTSKKILFIDPRGFFGDRDLYGIREYDIAKVLFALSGYDFFDSTKDFQLDYKQGNLNIPDFVLDANYEFLYPELHFLLVSIWLANCHCFLTNPTKLLISHAYARLLATKLLHS